MRVKVGDTWYEPEDGQPIMVTLSDDDKRNILNMAPGAGRYAVFTDKDSGIPEHKEAMIKWMDEGYDPAPGSETVTA